MAPTAKVFRDYLIRLFESATKQGLSSIDVTSGAVHREIGGYPGRNHRMPVCCSVMKENMKSGGSILSQPNKGQGATLVIRYILPR